MLSCVGVHTDDLNVLLNIVVKKVLVRKKEGENWGISKALGKELPTQ